MANDYYGLSSYTYDKLTPEEQELIDKWYHETHGNIDAPINERLISFKKYLRENVNGSNYGALIRDLKKSYEKYNANIPKQNTTNQQITNGSGSVTTSGIRDQDFYSKMSAYQQDLKDNLMLDPNSAQAQQYKQDMYNAINQYESDLEASLAASEMSAYAQLGQQQLELENTIADQRMKALKSGTTSAQLASQQLANMFSAQSGAAQVANNMMSNRLQNYNTISQARYGVTQDLYNTINANRQTYATAQPQLAAITGSYAANYDLPYAQFDAYKNLPEKIREELK